MMNQLQYLSNTRYRQFGIALLVCTLLLMVTPVALAGPVEPSPVELTQPDGTPFSADPFGDEWNNGMEYMGYTIIQSQISKYWVYAEQTHSGELRSSERRVGIDAPPFGTSQHIRDMTAVRPINTMPRLPESPDVWPGVSGSQPVLVLLVDFTPSTSLGTSAAQWNNAIFDDTAGAKSVKNAYDEASYNQFTIAPVAETQGTANDGIIEVTLGYAHPNTASSTGDPNRQLTKDALIAANAYINYGAYDTNGSGGLDVTELHIIVIPRGYERSFGSSSACSPSVWGHRWSLWGGISGPSLDSVIVGDYNYGGGYMQFGEWQDTTGGLGCPGSSDGNMATIGIIAHELGHDISWPDLYDTNGGSDGVGYWSLMGSGSWGYASGENAGTTPTLPDAFSRIYQKWVTPTVVSGRTNNVDIPHASASAAVYQLGDNPGGVDWHFGDSSGTGEYFLIENRMQTGFDAGLYRVGSTVGGCVIWHIDETRTSANTANADQTRRLIDVVEANSVQNLDSVGARGDGNDVWPGTNNYTSFGPTTTPGTNLHDGGTISVTVSGITASGATGCQVDLDDGTTPEPGPMDVYILVDLSGSFWDDIANFKLEASTMIADLLADNPDTRFGLGMFVDYPISPFGDAASGDKAYERIVDITSDSASVLAAIDALTLFYGADGPESQLPALYQAATGLGQDLSGVGYAGASIPAGQQANFRADATKLMVLWTDADFHHPGDPGSIPYPGPSITDTVDAINALGDASYVLGVYSGSSVTTRGVLAEANDPSEARAVQSASDLLDIVRGSGAIAGAGGVDCDGNGSIDIPQGAPLVCPVGSTGAGVGTAIVKMATTVIAPYTFYIPIITR